MPQCEELVIGKIHFKAHDLGGHMAARRLWKTYFAAIDGIVFLVDCSDQKRLVESKDELNKLLLADELQKVPFLILGNKTDKEGAVSEDQMKHILGITQSTTGKTTKKLNPNVQPMEVFMCSVHTRAGYKKGFQWLSDNLPDAS
jgi:GTP-binding protein SAR1